MLPPVDHRTQAWAGKIHSNSYSFLGRIYDLGFVVCMPHYMSKEPLCKPQGQRVDDLLY